MSSLYAERAVSVVLALLAGLVIGSYSDLGV